jgi:D-sedoheptulose 7-phosphate isomerase
MTSTRSARFPTEGGDASSDFVEQFISESISILSAINRSQVQACAEGLASVRANGGRLFVLGVGGSAGHASHAVNDFRKICGLEAYAPTDNVSELTARTNDEGWEGIFEGWLRISRIGPNDGILVFSVGGGSVELQVSVNLVRALEFGRDRGSRIFGIVGRDGGFTATVSDACVVIPPLFDNHVTPHTEGLCAVIWHLLVSHPLLAVSETKWESVTGSRRGQGIQHAGLDRD